MFTAHAVTLEAIELNLEADGYFGTRGKLFAKYFDQEDDAVLAAQQAAKLYDSIVTVYAKEVDSELEMEFSNPYYDPEKCGLIKVWEVDYGGSYEFDLHVVWFHPESGQLYYGSDSGCSCPTPFENIDSLGALERYAPRELGRLEEVLKSHLRIDDRLGAMREIRKFLWAAAHA